MLQLAESQPKLRQGLSDNCVRACSFAKDTVLALCGRAQTGQVSINELKEIRKNDNLMLQLFDASSTPDRDKKLGALAALQSVVKDRKEEYDTFSIHRKVLKYLIRFLDPKIAGILLNSWHTHIASMYVCMMYTHILSLYRLC